jgi:hypothetical protein
MFGYIKDCILPQTGWDVIFKKDSGILLPDGDKVSTVYVEMKNKHNTMNSAAASKTYIKMQGQLLSDDDCACFLVEVIARKSQNIPWTVMVDGAKQKHRKIRRLSMDEFYALVTGQKNAFYQICMVLPSVVANVVKTFATAATPKDTVYKELADIAEKKNGSFALALYLLGFKSYFGF